MEFTQEFIQENGLQENQIAALNETIESYVADLKKDWDGVANENAEKIITGAAQRVEQMTGIKREQGQKIADYLGMASENYLKGQKETLQRKEAELNEKIKTGGGSDDLKKQLEETEGKLSELKKIEAEYSEWKENDYKGKWEQATQELTGMKLNIAFTNVKPKFPDNVNEYEAKYKWDDFVNGVKEKYNIELDNNNEPIAIDKENEHKKVKLKDLVEKDKIISELSKGRQVTGLGGKKAEKEISGVPFKIDENATKPEISKQIKEYLTGEKGLSVISSEYAKEYAELYKKITQETAK